MLISIMEPHYIGSIRFEKLMQQIKASKWDEASPLGPSRSRKIKWSVDQNIFGRPGLGPIHGLAEQDEMYILTI